MGVIFKPITTEASLGTDTAGASNISSSEFVRIFNTSNVDTEHLVTLEEAGGTDIGTFTLGGHQSVIIQKEATDKLFAAHGSVKACGVTIVEVGNPRSHSRSFK